MRHALAALLAAGIAVAATVAYAAAPTLGTIVTFNSAYLPGNDRPPLVLPPAEHEQGRPLEYRNLHPLVGHSVTSDLCTSPTTGAVAISALPESCPAGYVRAFDSGVLSTGETGPVYGAEAIPPGEYGFSCQVHSEMRGGLRVL